MFNKLKLLIWKLNSSTNCPICGTKLIPHFREIYHCPRKQCKFNEITRKWN